MCSTRFCVEILRPGGLLFTRMGSRIGMEFEQVRPDIYRIGDGQEWFLVDEELLLGLAQELNGVTVDPLKTTIVQDYRCMTTWVLRKTLFWTNICAPIRECTAVSAPTT